VQSETEAGHGVLEDFRISFLECWHRLPNKAFFFTLLAVWLGLFQFLGNTTLGYIRSESPSLYRWLLNAYDPTGDYFRSDDGQRGIIIPLIVLGLFWWKRKQLLAQPLRTWTPGLLIVSFALLLHIAGYMVQQPKLSLIAVITGIYGLMGLTWGPAWLRTSFFPFFLLAFCVPLGAQALAISFPLRLLVCHLVDWTANTILAIDVVREGTILTNAAGGYQYDVAAACSGLRSLFATVALALTYGFIAFPSWWKRFLLIGSAFPLAVLGNLVRMLTIIIAAEIGGQEWGAKVHEGGPLGIFSLLPYVPAIFGLLLIGHWLREREVEPAFTHLEPKTA